MRASTFTRRGATLAAALVLLTSCAEAEPDSTQTPRPSSSTTASPTTAASRPPTSAVITTSADELNASFAQLAAGLAGDVGVTVYGGQEPRTFGTWNSGTAWSTIKVPLAVAALRRDPGAAGPLVTRVIVNSDNAAAESLWALLGSGEQAAKAVQEVLGEGGDTATTVQSQRVRPPFTPFGQTIWSQDQSARFVFGLPCVADAGEVLGKMRGVDAGQQWGLAGRAAVKGGWGPGESGGYLVRQLAVLEVGDKTIGVSLAAVPRDGAFESGTAMISKLGDWVYDHRADLPAGSCRR